MAFVDTVAWIALANTRDSLHAKARSIFDQLWQSDTRFLTSEFVLVELGNALSATSLRTQTALFIRSLNRAPSIEIIPSSTGLFKQGLELFESRSDKDWGLVDCTSFVIMNERNVDVAFTEDRHFTQAGFTILL
ncbi:MAG TPA: PIN domain-containing protein [Pyrinomonadaceae bacterium]|nr:PIN domain-containing protein [Pyrinomonadaceae bacterium]